MISNYSSKWGIKRSKENIRTEIIDIITNADKFILIGGYNFTFKTTGYTFFNELYRRTIEGIPILIIMPPNLSSYNSNQLNIITFCINNGIGLILNGNNHSKWILTDKDLYYGSSNFSETSWNTRVEVISIHNHSQINRQWKTYTINDFKDFVIEEINSIKRRGTMTRRRSLIVYTRIVWNQIKLLMLKLNPSIEKVIFTLENYDKALLKLENVSAHWFETEDFEDYQKVSELNFKILKKIDHLCFYAYTNIFNESSMNESSLKTNYIELDEKIIQEYNAIHKNLIATLDKSIEQLTQLKGDKEINLDSKNQAILNHFIKLLDNLNYT